MISLIGQEDARSARLLSINNAGELFSAKTRSMYSAELPRLQIFVESISGERKPFRFIFKGIISKELRVSTTRAVILLTLFADLHRRVVGRPQIEDLRRAATNFLDPANSNFQSTSRMAEQIRVGFYRLKEFWDEEFAGCGTLFFDSVSQRIFPTSSQFAPLIEIECVDAFLRDCLDETLSISALEQMKDGGCLFIPGGGNGSERLLREIYDTKKELNVVGFYVRPGLVTVPQSLLKKYVKSRDALKRYELAEQKFADGTLNLTEVVEISSIRQLARPNPDGTFLYYPGMTRNEAVEYFDCLIERIATRPNYELILTSMEIPFYVTAYDSGDSHVTIFFRVTLTGCPTGPTCFATSGKQTYISAVSQLFSWLRSQPNTINERAEVIAELKRHRNSIA